MTKAKTKTADRTRPRRAIEPSPRARIAHRTAPSRRKLDALPRGPVLPLVALPNDPAMVLSFYGSPENVIIRSTWGSDGLRYDAPIRSDDLAAACGTVDYQTGMLPPGILATGWRNGYPYYVMYIEPRRWRLPAIRTGGRGERHVESQAYYELPLPGLVWTGWKENYRLYATRATSWPTDPRLQLFHAPTANVYASGTICWGMDTEPRKVASPTTLLPMLKLLMEDTWFSDHSANGRSVRHPNNILDMWDEVIASKDEQYPLNDLCPSPYLLGHLVAGAIWK